MAAPWIFPEHVDAQFSDPTLISSLVGHTDPSFTLRRYPHAFESQRQRAAVPLDELLKAIDENEPVGAP